MRTNIEIDDKVIAKVMKETGARTKREAVDMGLKHLLDHARIMKAQRRLRDMRGKVSWIGDLEAMRLD